METRRQEYFQPIVDRIKELGFDEEIGTMVYALENFDCSEELSLICELYLTGNAEVQMSTSSILADQKFMVTKDELQKVEQRLIENGLEMKDFKIKYSVKEQ